MKKFLTVKNVFMIKIIISFIISAFAYLYSMTGNQMIDHFISQNYTISILLFLSIIIISLYNGYVFNVVKESVETKPQNMLSMLKLLNYQILLYSGIYFFCFAVLSKNDFSFGLRKNMILNIILIVGYLLYQMLKYKRDFFNINKLIGSIVIVSLLIQLNYFELIFFSLYFSIIWLFNKIDLKIMKHIVKSSKKILFVLFICVSSIELIFLIINETNLILWGGAAALIAIAAKIINDDKVIFLEVS